MLRTESYWEEMRLLQEENAIRAVRCFDFDGESLSEDNLEDFFAFDTVLECTNLGKIYQGLDQQSATSVSTYLQSTRSQMLLNDMKTEIESVQVRNNNVTVRWQLVPQKAHLMSPRNMHEKNISIFYFAEERVVEQIICSYSKAETRSLKCADRRYATIDEDV